MFFGIIILVGYLLGSIPFGMIVARAKGIDILHSGSGTIGATNVKRVMGTSSGYVVFFLDCLKGLLPVLLAKTYFGLHPHLANNVGTALLVGLILGHNYSIFLKFHGGKGVATSIGGLIVLMPSAVFLGLILWYSVFTVTRFVSLASLCFALSLPLNAYLFAYQKEIIALAFFLMAIIFLGHVSNLRRLWKGEEFRFGGKK
ncbi:MAG: glycerol-3-phosphate 1-O-acyltransferase PlsY [Puniceicoccales bacterium]|jgi:glycerol-3-phosphate acyltransferase PlsY|nr:glycerol-3-phosphate 1-O-acyltransferase PlsY [Puniceicoccales bacterium]